MKIEFSPDPCNEEIGYHLVWLGYGYRIQVRKLSNCYQIIPLYTHVVVGEVRTEYTLQEVDKTIDSVVKDLNKIMKKQLGKEGIFPKKDLLIRK